MELDAAVRGHRCHTGGETRCQGGERDLGRSGAVVLGGEDLWMVSVDRVDLTVHVLCAEAGEVGDRSAAVGPSHPLAARPPLKASGLGVVRESLAGAAQ